MYQAKMEEMMGRQEKEEEALNQEAKDAIRELEAIQASVHPARSPVVVGPLLPCHARIHPSSLPHSTPPPLLCSWRRSSTWLSRRRSA